MATCSPVKAGRSATRAGRDGGTREERRLPEGLWVRHEQDAKYVVAKKKTQQKKEKAKELREKMKAKEWGTGRATTRRKTKTRKSRRRKMATR